MASHRSTADAGPWERPLVDGAPARTWAVVSVVALILLGAEPLLALVLELVSPRLSDASSPAAVLEGILFVTAAVAVGVGLFAMFRQSDRESALGYSTLSWGWLRGTGPLVNPRTRRIVGGGTAQFDAVTARARAPWSSETRARSTARPLDPSPRIDYPRAIARQSSIATIVLAALAIWFRVQPGSVSGSDALRIGGIVIAIMVVAVLVAAFAFRAVQSRHLANVSRVATGIVIACYCAPHVLAVPAILGVRRGAIPRAAVLVFDADGLSIWRGSSDPAAVVSITRNDVIGLDTTTILSGRTTVPGLQITVIPLDERWPFIMEFSVFDPSRILAAANEAKLRELIQSISLAWCDARDTDKS